MEHYLELLEFNLILIESDPVVAPTKRKPIVRSMGFRHYFWMVRFN